MEKEGYLIIDIETCPIDLDKYKELTDEEEKKKLINPIDSRIVAIGIRHKDQNIVIAKKSEKELLEDFWLELKTIKKGNSNVRIVGFNIKNFDMSFLVSRSYIHNVPITSFLLKDLVDLREKVTAYRYGPTRGTLKEFAQCLDNVKIMDIDGSHVAGLYIADDMKKITEYLENDLEMTDKMFERLKNTNILHIDKW
jgi:DNA polymerase elongation subunit (family B)